jgi:hypothetical protein
MKQLIHRHKKKLQEWNICFNLSNFILLKNGHKSF